MLREQDAVLKFELVGGRLSGKVIGQDAAIEGDRMLFDLLDAETYSGSHGERVWIPFPDRSAVDEYEVDHRQRIDEAHVIARCYYLQTIPLSLPR
jgi:hypothetical protein